MFGGMVSVRWRYLRSVASRWRSCRFVNEQMGCCTLGRAVGALFLPALIIIIDGVTLGVSVSHLQYHLPSQWWQCWWSQAPPEVPPRPTTTTNLSWWQGHQLHAGGTLSHQQTYGVTTRSPFNSNGVNHSHQHCFYGGPNWWNPVCMLNLLVENLA